LSIVESDSSKIWDLLLGTVKLEVLVNGGVDGIGSCGLNLCDDLRNDGALDEWDEDTSNLGDEGS